MSIVVAPDSLFGLAGNRVETRAKDCKKQNLKSWKNLSESKSMIGTIRLTVVGNLQSSKLTRKYDN